MTTDIGPSTAATITGHAPFAPIAVGAVAGLAWAAGFRGFGLVALAPIVGWTAVAATVGGSLGLAAPRGAWVTLLFAPFVAVVALGCAIPHRGVVRRTLPK